MPLGPLDVGRPAGAKIIRMSPSCYQCSSPASYLAPAVIGDSFDWHFVCQDHVVGWFDEADWVAPVYYLSSINHL
jgi:hypothetical protein